MCVVLEMEVVGMNNTWRDMGRTVLKDVVPLDTPYAMFIEVSTICNAKCVYCAHSTWAGKQENMGVELFEKILNDLKIFPRKIKKFDMFGFGEPLCNPNLPALVRMAKESGVVDKVDFITNGMLFSQKNIDELIAAGTDTIRISLQGLDSEIYRKTCGVDINFEKFIENLTYLYANKKNCKIYMKIADIALDNYENGMKKLHDIFDSISDGVYVEHIIPLFPEINYDDIDAKINKQNRRGEKNKRILKVCSKQFFMLRVGVTGDVTSVCCDPTQDLVYGNIYQTHLIDLWNKGKHKSFLKFLLEGRRFSREACKDCVSPNDIGSEKDILDDDTDEILMRF